MHQNYPYSAQCKHTKHCLNVINYQFLVVLLLKLLKLSTSCTYILEFLRLQQRLGYSIENMAQVTHKAWYTLATQLNSTRLTLWSSTVLLWRPTHWQQSRPYRQQSQPRQAIEFKVLPMCCQNQQQSRPHRQQSQPYTATVDFVASFGNSRLSTK